MTMSVLLAFVLAPLLLPQTLFAQSTQTMGIKISPAQIEENVDPGHTYSYVVHITNPDTFPLTLYPVVHDIVGLGPEGQPVFAVAGEDSTYRLSSWVTFKESRIDLAPGESADVHATVVVPKDAPPGGHFGSLALTQNAPKDIPIGAGVGFETGANLLLQVAGDIVEDTRFRSFSTSRLVYGTPDVEFRIALENLGTVIARPVGIIDITNMWGKKAGSIPANDVARAIFPKTKREFTTRWTSDELEFGRYTATASFAIQETSGVRTVSSSAQFWIIPMNIVLPMGIGLLVFVVLLWIMLRLYVRKQLRAHGIAAKRGTAAREAASLSRLSMIVIALLIAVVLGLAVLFIFFG